MKIAIYSDRLLEHYFGGAELYSIRLAELLSEKNTVTIFCNKNTKAKKRLHALTKDFPKLDSEITVVTMPGVGSKNSLPYKEYRAHKWLSKNLRMFDIFINISNNLVGGIKGIPSYAFIHFPLYFHNPKLSNFPFSKYINNNYTKSYTKFIGNSKFTKKYIELQYNTVVTEYIYPIPNINDKKVSLDNKSNIILYAGRIDRDKSIDVLINSFKQLTTDENFNDYQLIIAGYGNDTNYLNELKVLSKGLDVKFKTSISTKELNDLYNKAKIYWHSKGYKAKQPWQFEHFGMSTVEAMSHGCSPIVFKGGGQTEIVDGECGFLWETPEDLISYTKSSIADEKKLQNLQNNSINKSLDFSLSNYKKHLQEIFDLDII